MKELAPKEVINRILDPKDFLNDVIAALKDHWSYDLYTRRPGPALVEDGVLSSTDLDLACFFAALVERSAVINIPTYKSLRAATKREGEYIVSKDNRHGHVLGLTANKDVFTFSIRINDMNVMSSDGSGKDTVGAPRNFTLVDTDGQWYDGWKKIVFLPSRKENAFLEDKRLWTGNEVVFKNFIHPNRWISFYGRWYLLTKILIDRLRAETTFCNSECKRLEAAGIRYPETGPGAQQVWPATESEPGEPVKVKAFEAEIDGVTVPTAFPGYEVSQAGLVAAKARAKQLRYYDVPMLSFATRATELAFANAAGWRSGVLKEPLPAWYSDGKWERDHKIKRTLWNRLPLDRSVSFLSDGACLRYRIYEKTERVA